MEVSNLNVHNDWIVFLNIFNLAILELLSESRLYFNRLLDYTLSFLDLTYF